MLVDIVVTVPTLLIAHIAWYIRLGLLLISLILLFAIAIGAFSLYRTAKIRALRDTLRRLSPKQRGRQRYTRIGA